MNFELQSPYHHFEINDFDFMAPLQEQQQLQHQQTICYTEIVTFPNLLHINPWKTRGKKSREEPTAKQEI